MISPRLLALLIGAALGASMLPSLSGCVAGDRALTMALEVLSGEDLALNEQAKTEFARFTTVYDRYAKPSDSDRQARHFRDAFKRMRVKYVRPVDDAKLIDAAIKGVEGLDAKPGSIAPPELVEAALDSMMGSLDPHSSYLNPKELEESNQASRGEFGGLGIEVTMENGLVKVISPIEGTPAFRAGIEPGDVITHTDGASIEGATLMQAVRRMRGEPGTRIILTIRRHGVEPFDVAITRAIIQVRSVRWRSEGDFGYVRVVSFTERVEDGIETAMEAIRDKLGRRMKGLVLDLRSNPGGLLDQSVALADAFLDSGVIVSVRGRNKQGDRIYEAEEGDLAQGLPMVVLINGGSASASEIVASALRDNGRATVLGVRSYGKGSVQTISPLPIEGALRLTTQLYYAPSGRTIQATGVVPNIILVPKEPLKRQREADLPGALPAEPANTGAMRATVSEADCPVIKVGKREDRPLGCALAFLKAGSADKFLASVTATRPNM